MVNNTDGNTIQLRSRWLRTCLICGVAASSLLGVICAIGAAISYAEPGQETQRLYDASRWLSQTAPLVLMVFFFALLGLGMLSRRSPNLAKAAERAYTDSRKWFHVALVVALVVIVSAVLPGFTNVHPEGTKWVSTGHAGTWEIPESLARNFLWRKMRAEFGSGLVLAFVLVLATSSFLRSTRSVACASSRATTEM